MSQPRTSDTDASRPASEIAGRLFLIACSFGITIGVIGIAGMLLAAVAFATASAFEVPLVATFAGFHDSGGTNAVTVTGSWAAAGTLSIVLASALSLFVLRRRASIDANTGGRS